jgi:hypothetical protein
MADKGKMPPQLLAHFKSKAEGKEGQEPDSDQDDKKSDKDKRKEAVKKARIRMEETSRKKDDKQKEAG